MNFILGKKEKEQKDFKQFCVELAKAYSLCAATDEGKNNALEVSYFKAVKASLTKHEKKGPPKNIKKRN
ncbi:type I restriction enzyme endonuclease domain-containing protein [Bacillus salacetis]|uniref:type I restriction enzyme endonuclease domain-containing protein n=1 Tax=Bacillus salacetis TaxID=2315464 RepID=UPI003BA08175